MAIKQLPSFEFLNTAVEALKKVHEKCDKWQETFNEMFDGHFVPVFNEPLESAVIKMVELAFDDEPHPDYGSIFSWWVYDCDFGAKKELSTSLRVKGKSIPVTNVKELYKYYEGIFESERD